MKEYKNRYGYIYTFTEDDDHDILWEGNFEYCSFSMPNDYTRAYAEYLREGGDMELDEFKVEVHSWDDKTFSHVYPKYIKMVDCLRNEIDTLDPSGGPYISRGMPLDSFGFKNCIVQDFKRIDTGYKIITEKCPKCHLAAGVHKMGCETQKVTILLDDEKTKCYCGHTTYCECGPDATSDAVIDALIDVVNRQDDNGLGSYNDIVDEKGNIVGFIKINN